MDLSDMGCHFPASRLVIGGVADRNPAGRLPIRRSRALGEIDLTSVSDRSKVSRVSMCIYRPERNQQDNNGNEPWLCARDYMLVSLDTFGSRRVDLGTTIANRPRVSLATYHMNY